MRKVLNKRNTLLLSALLAVILIVGLIVPAIAMEEQSKKIQKFEKINPVYTQIVEKGTKQEELGLPDSLRAVMDLPEGMDVGSYVQSEPIVDMSDGYEHYDYYHYGYVAPKNAEDAYAAGEKVIYSIYYAKQDGTGGVGETAYRLYGSITGSENVWFSCDENGNITGVVLDVPVTWSDGGYDENQTGEYTFTASFSDYSYDQERPYAKILVEEEQTDSHEEEQNDNHREEQHCTCEVKKDEASGEHAEDCPWYVVPEVSCTCNAAEDEAHQEDCPLYVKPAEDCHCGINGEAIDAENFPWAHQEDCIHFSPIECMCREQVENEVEETDCEGNKTGNHMEMIPGGLSHVHDTENKDCPLYGRDTVRIKKLSTGGESVMGQYDAECIAAAQAEGKTLYPALGEIEIITGSEQRGHAEVMSRAGYMNSAYMDAYMLQNTPTSGNADWHWQFENAGNPTTSGAWTDYINTIWFNKAYKKFDWTPAEDTGAYNGWAWSGTMAGESTGDVTTNPLRIPTKSGRTWTVYSGEQLVYALSNLSSRDDIQLGGNLNLNGNEHNWRTVTIPSTIKILILNGNNNTIFNLGLFHPNYDYTNMNFIKGTVGSGTGYIITVRDLTFTSVKNVGVGMEANDVNALFQLNGYQGNIYNVNLRNGLHYMKDESSGNGGTVGTFLFCGFNSGTVRNCSVTESYLYQWCHANPFASTFSGAVNVSKSYISDTLIATIGFHSSGFMGCYGGTEVKVRDCFTALEMYGSYIVSGFRGFNVTTENCFSTGKVEGYSQLGGFGWASHEKTINNCYSTALVGLRSSPTYQGGFLSNEKLGDALDGQTVSNCYAAGEVGNYDTDMDMNKTFQGGFIDYYQTKIPSKFTNCYYDKQTTAMREWTSGKSKSIPGVTGVLTTDTTSSGTGLASGTYGGVSDKGFKGFSDNDQWVYRAGHYPQLEAFANASTSTGWGSEENANLVRAYSLASTSTVFLNTWDTGYDWDNEGVRTAAELSYDRTLSSTGKTDHKGYALTYDTVREIVTDASVTSDSDWSHMIAGGAPADTDDDGTPDGNSMEITATDGIQIKAPGMDWYKISATVGEQTGYRPIRLIAYMEVEAGADMNVISGQKFNHRSDVSLYMMDNITDNLVVGIDDNKIWSTAKQGGYPDTSKYWKVPTTDMETDFSASKDAWLYTEIWRAKQNTDLTFVTDPVNGYGSENLVPDLSVKVTGSGTGKDLTLTEQKWNGEVPLYLDTSAQRKYIVTYYWMLKDGRYRTDTKIITITPDKYNVGVNVKNNDDDTNNSSSLYLGAAKDNHTNTDYTYSTGTLSDLTAGDVPYTNNSALAWKKRADTVVITKSRLTMTARDGTVIGTVERPGDLAAGDSITIPLAYYYLTYEWSDVQNAFREVTALQEGVNVTYKVVEDNQGGLCLRFNKLANAPSDEIASALVGGDTTGIEDTLAYINDTQYNIDLTLWVREGMPFEFIKTDEDGNHFGADEAEFQLYACTHIHDGDNHSILANNDTGCCWDVDNPLKTAVSDADGKVLFDMLVSGDYILAETRTRDGYQLPLGQWLLQVDSVEETITITAKGNPLPPAFWTETTGEGESKVITLRLPNHRKFTIPSTGGRGPILLTVSGIVLAGGAAILLILSKKKRSNER